MSEFTPFVFFLAIFGVGYALVWAWHAFSGEEVGIAKGLMQGEHAVPGMRAIVAVKRRLVDRRPLGVELQVRCVGSIKNFSLTPGRARDLAGAIEEAVALSRGPAP